MTEPMESNEDILISRIIDGHARADDLRQLSTLALADNSVWDRLAEADADREALCLAVESEIAVAQGVAAPMRDTEAPAGPYRFVGWTGWMGWAAAAAVVFAWTVSSRGPVSNGTALPGAGIQNVSLTADDALAQYIKASKAEDRFIKELPKVMVESHLAADGRSTEVTYLRQFVEKATVNDLYELSTDEHGRPGAVRVNSPIGTQSVLY